MYFSKRSKKKETFTLPYDIFVITAYNAYERHEVYIHNADKITLYVSTGRIHAEIYNSKDELIAKWHEYKTVKSVEIAEGEDILTGKKYCIFNK